jgi:hypothetical protein
MITDIIKNRFRENLEMIVKEARELAIGNIFGNWERSYEMLSSLLAVIQNSTHGTKYNIETSHSIKFGVEILIMLHGHLVCAL